MIIAYQTGKQCVYSQIERDLDSVVEQLKAIPGLKIRPEHIEFYAKAGDASTLYTDLLRHVDITEESHKCKFEKLPKDEMIFSDGEKVSVYTAGVGIDFDLYMSESMRYFKREQDLREKFMKDTVIHNAMELHDFKDFLAMDLDADKEVVTFTKDALNDLEYPAFVNVFQYHNDDGNYYYTMRFTVVDKTVLDPQFTQ